MQACPRAEGLLLTPLAQGGRDAPAWPAPGWAEACTLNLASAPGWPRCPTVGGQQGTWVRVATCCTCTSKLPISTQHHMYIVAQFFFFKKEKQAFFSKVRFLALRTSHPACWCMTDKQVRNPPRPLKQRIMQQAAWAGPTCPGAPGEALAGQRLVRACPGCQDSPRVEAPVR